MSRPVQDYLAYHSVGTVAMAVEVICTLYGSLNKIRKSLPIVSIFISKL